MSDAAPSPSGARSALWRARLAARGRQVEKTRPIVVEGMLRRVVGLTLEAVGCEAPVGSRCLVDSADGGSIETEVVGFADGRLYLMPTGTMHGVLPNARVRPSPHDSGMPAGDALLGRVVDATGAPLDGRGPLGADQHTSLKRAPINPMQRQPISQPLDVGVRAINALLTVGRGQRMGLFAGSGVG
jgi:flagellum-specific ATP synthase